MNTTISSTAQNLTLELCQLLEKMVAPPTTSDAQGPENALWSG